MPKNKGNDAGTTASLPAGVPGPARGLEVIPGRSDLPAIFPCLSSGYVLCVLLGARQRRKEVTPGSQFGYIGVEPTPFFFVGPPV